MMSTDKWKKDLTGTGYQPSYASLAEESASAAVTTAYVLSHKAADSIKHSAVYLPTYPVPTTAPIVLAFAFTILVRLLSVATEEGVSLDIHREMTSMGELFFLMRDKEEVAKHLQAGARAFSELSQAAKEHTNVREWRELLEKTVLIYLLQRVDQSDQLDKFDPIWALGRSFEVLLQSRN
jgi:hypothetical protein